MFDKGKKRLGLAGVAVAVAIVLAASCGGKHSPLLFAEDDLVAADVIVVLGYGPPVDDAGVPVPELARRVERGVELYRSGLAPALIVTGGNTYREYYESTVMKDLAVSLGVPAEAIIEEREAMDTIGNARYSAKIMGERGWDSCIVVSSPYHLKRAKRLFEAAGVAVQTSGCAVPDNPFYGLGFTVYETLVRIQYAFIDEEGLVGGEQGDEHADRIKGPVRTRSEATP